MAKLSLRENAQADDALRPLMTPALCDEVLRTPRGAAGGGMSDTSGSFVRRALADISR